MIGGYAENQWQVIFPGSGMARALRLWFTTNSDNKMHEAITTLPLMISFPSD